MTKSESSPLGNLDIVRRLTLPLDDPQRLVINPLVHSRQVGTTSIDLRLGTEWELLRSHRFLALDPAAEQGEVEDLINAGVEEFQLSPEGRYGAVLHPGELLLAQTLEYLKLPSDLWGQLEGRSTWARLGLQVHATAGMVDCGFSGYLTLELQNTGRIPLVLYPGLRVGQMAFFPVSGVAMTYNKKPTAAYSGQSRARSAFARQPEHLVRNAYVVSEQAAERVRRGQ